MSTCAFFRSCPGHFTLHVTFMENLLTLEQYEIYTEIFSLTYKISWKLFNTDKLKVCSMSPVEDVGLCKKLSS